MGGGGDGGGGEGGGGEGGEARVRLRRPIRFHQGGGLDGGGGTGGVLGGGGGDDGGGGGGGGEGGGGAMHFHSTGTPSASAIERERFTDSINPDRLVFVVYLASTSAFFTPCTVGGVCQGSCTSSGSPSSPLPNSPLPNSPLANSASSDASSSNWTETTHVAASAGSDHVLAAENV